TCSIMLLCCLIFFFFFQAEDGIRDLTVTGVQTCALPISPKCVSGFAPAAPRRKASHAAYGMTQCEPRHESVTRRECGQPILSDVPSGRNQRSQKPTREHTPSLHRVKAENLVRMSGVVTEVEQDIKNLCAHNPAQDNE